MKLEMKEGEIAEQEMAGQRRRGVKTSEKTASLGHNISLKNEGQEEGKGRGKNKK
jgi:hypothetical protein